MFYTQKLPLALCAFVLLLGVSCKKGEEDPSISLASRKSRLSADWRMSSGYAAFTLNLTDPPLKYNESYTFDGTSYRLNTTESGALLPTRASII